MNKSEVTAISRQKHLLGKLFLIIIIYILSNALLLGQEPEEELVYPGPYKLEKQWFDKNGQNILQITISALCTEKTYPMGFKSKITARLKNKNYNLKKIYDNPDYEMTLLSFNEEDIIFKLIDGSEAVFIPFYYCGNADSQVKVSYIIFHNKKRYLKHIYFDCIEYKNCALPYNLDKELKKMPDSLKKEFENQLYKEKILLETNLDFY